MSGLGFFEWFGWFGGRSTLFTFLGADYASAHWTYALLFGFRLTKAGFTLAGGARTTTFRD